MEAQTISLLSSVGSRMVTLQLASLKTTRRSVKDLIYSSYVHIHLNLKFPLLEGDLGSLTYLPLLLIG